MERHLSVQFRTVNAFAPDQSAASPPSCRAARADEAPRRSPNTVDESPLIDNLRMRRQSLGWSIKDLVDRSGLDERSLSEWERGAASPQLGAAQLWAAALGLNFALVAADSAAKGGLAIDWDKRRVTVDGKPVRLTPMEWKALERLAWAPGELVTHQALFQHLYGVERDYRAQSTAVRVLVTKLRRLLPLRISAHWGKGYVLSGVEPSRAHAPAPAGGTAAPTPEPAKIQCDRVDPVPSPTMRTVLTMRRDFAEFSHGEVRHIADPPPRHLPCRAEELGVIERFLAEHGATRCPDGATIQQSPLPTLVWDKLKRKWVRPAAGGPQEH